MRGATRASAERPDFRRPPDARNRSPHLPNPAGCRVDHGGSLSQDETEQAQGPPQSTGGAARTPPTHTGQIFPDSNGSSLSAATPTGVAATPISIISTPHRSIGTLGYPSAKKLRLDAMITKTAPRAAKPYFDGGFQASGSHFG